jgi:adenylate cyclase class IV
MNELQRRQLLQLNLINYDLDKMWNSHPLIERLRERIRPLFPEGLYDPQDLEHQVLFRLTTYHPDTMTDELLARVIDEQYTIMENRLSRITIDRAHLFRGLSGKYHDLNVIHRLELCWEGQKLVAKNRHRSLAVDFRVVNNHEIVSLFTNELHYIHQDRPKGETFAFYFSGDDIPWAIETTEPSVITKQYKRDALLAQGIDPNKAIELTRFYTLPGAPTNAISLMDGLVTRYYQAKGIEALFTTTMPMYSKTKSTTISGGINQPLLVKDLVHKFIPEILGDKTYYRHVTTVPENQSETEVITTHPAFPMMYAVEVFRIIGTLSGKPLSQIKDRKKVIYVRQRKSYIEKEVKFRVTEIATALYSLRSMTKYTGTSYIRDTIFGLEGVKKRLRLRVEDDNRSCHVEVSFKNKIETEDGIKVELEELFYNGDSVNEAQKAIAEQWAFKEQNSYEKIRMHFAADGAELSLDVYPHGVWLEIEAETDLIWLLAKKLGYSKEDALDSNADELFLAWCKKHEFKEYWDVRFGFTGKS